jgi:hypothetical protein
METQLENSWVVGIPTDKTCCDCYYSDGDITACRFNEGVNELVNHEVNEWLNTYWEPDADNLSEGAKDCPGWKPIGK